MDANGREKETQITRMNTDLEKLKRNMDGQDGQDGQDEQDEQDCFCEMKFSTECSCPFASIRGLKKSPVFYPQILRMRAD
jgi:hypothetical protein